MSSTPSLPAPFVQQMEELLGPTESLRFFEALEQPSPVSIRFNPYKVRSRPEGNPVPWCRYGYYLNERPQFTLDPLFHGGAYYVQEASSMFVEHVFRSVFEAETSLRVLDLCAAPGGKSTLLSTLVGAEGVVVANEVMRPRAMTLADNIKKWGIGNVVVTQNDPSHFTPFEHYFDFILVDAPCSGEGMFRKDPQARSEWSEGNVALCAARSRRILSDIWSCLRPGGVLLFSTCTFNRQENEETVQWLRDEYEAEPLPISVDPSWGITEGEVEGISTFRFYPHRTSGEGFFAAAMRKPQGRIRQQVPRPRKTPFTELARKEKLAVAPWFNQPEYMNFYRVGDQIYSYYREAFPTIRQLSENLTVLYSGVLTGQLFGAQLRPEHPLALFHDLNREMTPVSELELSDALNYLRKSDIPPTLLSEGVNLITYEGLPLGWIKRIGGRSNNMYPKELRIVHL